MMDSPRELFIISLISHRTQKPRIEMKLGELRTQMSADSAMDVAHNIIECCMGAYADAFLWHFLKEKVNADDGPLVAMLQDFRKFRDELARDFKEEQERP